MGVAKLFSPQTLPQDLIAGTVVFLVALPLCLGVASASGAEMVAGLIAGIVGGLVVGAVSKSHTSVSGPAAGLTAVVIAQVATLGSFQAFALAVVIAGLIQIVFGLLKAGFMAAFFPSSVIKGLLTAIGVILILKQIPHLFGHDIDPEDDMAFMQRDQENTFSELWLILDDLHPSAVIVGLASLALLICWEKTKRLKKSLVPAPLVVVVLGVAGTLLFEALGGKWLLGGDHLVKVPSVDSFNELGQILKPPAWGEWLNPKIYLAAFTIAVVASLETLLNLEAVDKLDPQQRTSPPNRELWAQGIGNILSGCCGGLPVTSVIVRSSVNINAGGKTRLSTIVHGTLLLVCVLLLPGLLNLIPLSCLAAILIVTGFKLASPKLLSQMWKEGPKQFLPFTATVVGIILTDLLIGILIGLAVSVAFILHSNVRRPLRRVVEKHLGGDVLRVELANQVSFLSRAALAQILTDVPEGGHVLLDARQTDYIDPDILDLLTDFKNVTAPARNITISFLGFQDQYAWKDHVQYVDYSTRDLQNKLTPAQVLQILRDGNERFRTGERLTRDLMRGVDATAKGQFPIAAVLGCIDSRVPAELIFDLGVGDLFSSRIAGNVAPRKALGSLEYACAVAGTKLIVVLGHTRCGAINAAVNLFHSHSTAQEQFGCEHLDGLLNEIQQAIDPNEPWPSETPPEPRDAYLDSVTRRNVLRTIATLRERSGTLDRLVREGRLAIVGGLYDITTGRVDFLFAESADQAVASWMVSDSQPVPIIRPTGTQQ